MTDGCGLLPSSQMDNPGYEVERLYTDVTFLCSRIQLLPCSTAKDRLAQSGENAATLIIPHVFLYSYFGFICTPFTNTKTCLVHQWMLIDPITFT